MKPKVCLVMSDAATLRAFLQDQVARMATLFDLTIVTPCGGEEEVEGLGIPARVRHFRIERRISPGRDLAALWGLYRFLRRERFDLVQTYTPKAGLLGMLAGWLSGVPCRCHWFLGQVWVTRRGLMRSVLKAADRVTAQCATSILVDSHSQHAFLIREGICGPPRSRVLLNGSICGVDCEKWTADEHRRETMRAEWGIPSDATVFLYMSRLTRDKGALVMADAFRQLGPRAPKAVLVMVGPDEEGLRPPLQEILRPVAERVIFHGFTTDPVSFMVAADALCLPSFREGFGQVLINASAVGIPALAARIYGSIDAVVDRETGLLHTAGDVSELAGQMEFVCRNPEQARRWGARGRARVMKEFAQEDVTRAVIGHYLALLRQERPRNCDTGEPGDAQRGRGPGRGVALVIKRGVDCLAALLALIALSPFLLAVAGLVWVSMGRPVLFTQQRPGCHGRPFRLLKFRTMVDGAGPDQERLTSLGRFLRAWSLDELPELWNVVRGEMSLVGPRPLLVQYLSRYSARQARRHEVKPGLTGWAQVNGRNALTWEARFELDVWYVENWSLWLDARILALTVWRVLRREGISHDGTATMTEFMGTSADQGRLGSDG